MNDTAAPGDAALFAAKDRRSYIRVLTPGDSLHTHLGALRHDDAIGQRWGAQISTHSGSLFYLLQPGFEDLLAHARHETTFIQPKDLGYIAVRMSLHEGATVIEAGTGSGALTTWLALITGASGRVISYDRRPAESARKLLARAELPDRVTFKTRDIAEGFDETDADALFLDVPNPQDYLAQARAALRGGGWFGAIVPTMNQVIDLTTALYRGPWFRVEVEEIWQRSYKVVPARLRPEDRMIGHTGYLAFARAVHRPLTIDDSSETQIQEENDP